jgi:hypothetical protein
VKEEEKKGRHRGQKSAAEMGAGATFDWMLFDNSKLI